MLSQPAHCQFPDLSAYHRGTPDALPSHSPSPPSFLLSPCWLLQRESAVVPQVTGAPTVSCIQTRGCIQTIVCGSSHGACVCLTIISLEVSALSQSPASQCCLFLLPQVPGPWASPWLTLWCNNQALCSSAQLCVGWLDWCVQDIPGDLFIGTPRSLPGAVVHYRGSDTCFWSLRF